MLFPMALHEPIRRGEVEVAYRVWKRPTVVAGGTLVGAFGLLRIDAVDEIDDDLTEADARAAGVESLAKLRASFRAGEDRKLYRIVFHREGDDPRLELRADDDLDDEAVAALTGRLAKWDQASPTGPWTRPTLEVISRSPGVVSTELADEVGVDRPTFKRRVRQLKGLGLTESLEVGYRLSPRGDRFLAATAD